MHIKVAEGAGTFRMERLSEVDPLHPVAGSGGPARTRIVCCVVDDDASVDDLCKMFTRFARACKIPGADRGELEIVYQGPIYPRR